MPPPTYPAPPTTRIFDITLLSSGILLPCQRPVRECAAALRRPFVETDWRGFWASKPFDNNAARRRRNTYEKKFYLLVRVSRRHWHYRLRTNPGDGPAASGYTGQAERA